MAPVVAPSSYPITERSSKWLANASFASQRGMPLAQFEREQKCSRQSIIDTYNREIQTLQEKLDHMKRCRDAFESVSVSMFGE